MSWSKSAPRWVLKAINELGGEDRLRLVLGAQGFWYDARQHQAGFYFYSVPKDVGFHIVLSYFFEGFNMVYLVKIRTTDPHLPSMSLVVRHWSMTGYRDTFHVHTGCSLDLL